MKTLKISFLLALFLTVSSQTYKAPEVTHIVKEAQIENFNSPYQLIVHSKDRIVIPTQL